MARITSILASFKRMLLAQKTVNQDAIVAAIFAAVTITVFPFSGDLLQRNGIPADTEGVILELKRDRITFQIEQQAANATHLTYEVQVNENTNINGENANFSALETHQEVEIWFLDEERNNQVDTRMASKIVTK